MSTPSEKSQRTKPGRLSAYLIASAVAAALLAAGALLWSLNRDEQPGEAGAAVDLAAAHTVSAFYTGLAALDVEENERAGRVLEEAVAAEPEEPALWANLAVAQLRLNEPDKARESLRRALELAGDSRELAVLNAQVLEYSGDVEAAIAQLRAVHQDWPENVAVTFSLVSLLGQIRSDQAEQDRLELLNDVVQRVPGNLRALSEQARVAAKLERAEELRSAIDALQRAGDPWPEPLQQQLTQAGQAADAGDFRQAALSLTFFENLLKPRPAYQESLTQLGIFSGAAVGTPLRSLLRTEIPPAQTSDADVALSFELLRPAAVPANADRVWALERSVEGRPSLVRLSNDQLLVDASSELPFPGSESDATAASIAMADLNADFQQDLICVGAEGCRIFLAAEDGSFVPLKTELAEFDRPWLSVWTADVEADGDMDLLLSDHQATLLWIRNNGDRTFRAMDSFLPAEAVIDLSRVDFDLDGDIDLITLNASGAVLAWQNQRGGNYLARPLSDAESEVAIAVGDIDSDGQMELISLNVAGEIRVARWTAENWSRSTLMTWAASASSSPADVPGNDVYLTVADFDNNGAVDVLTSRAGHTSLWLRSEDLSWLSLSEVPAMRVTSVVDYNGDGLLDLVGTSASGESVAVSRSPAGYGWLVLKPQANTTAGDNRINSLGIGGRIEVRAGALVQARTIDSPRVHFGLGRHQRAEVARIIWPNGTVQAEFDLQSGQEILAHQRLKGSCPWLFTFDGERYRFIKDFIWRSPLGLKINAQSTAGVTQTLDWIKISSDQLAAVDGRYSLRITAELWETHFFDHVALLAVDHPAEVEVFVDERFVPQAAPPQSVTTVTQPQPLQNIVDDQGTALDEVLHANDGTYADGFALGDYQGVAQEHWVEFTVPADVAADRPVILIGHGWIYPTDSSLNVALDQGQATRPFGLILEQQQADGVWKTLQDNLGFPAGKNKDVLLELPAGALAHSRRFRLRTNMEIYWDSLRWSYLADDVQPRITPLTTVVSNLRHRGFSKLLPEHRRRPDTPVYELAGTAPRWLDLEGFYTRFGDVRELLSQVDDRYVILNAGDELVLEFDAVGTLPANWQRDFVLVGDGWVKDGDFNTAFSQFVRPLPTHSESEYAGPLVPLHEDPVFRRNPHDWQQYHTRYITPQPFHKKLWRPTVPPANTEVD